MSMRWVVSVVASMALVVAGCGGGADDDGGRASSSSASGSPATAEKTGGEFSVGAVEPDFLNPGRAGLAFDMLQALFAPLAKIDANGELQMVAAESIESDDQKTWTIKLKPGWTFHDGEPVTAQTYVDSWNAVAYGPNGWENNGQLAKVEGYAALNPAEGKPKTRKMSGLKVVDDTTFTVTLTAPDSQFPLAMTAGQVGLLPIPPKGLEDPKAFNEAPIGNGPYKIDGTWKHNQSVRVVRYEDYKGPKPNADAITFKIYSDLKVAYRDVQAGNLDIVNIGQDQYQSAKKDFGDALIAFQAPSMDFLLFGPKDERFKDPAVRKAFMQAIDTEAINTALFGGLLPPASSIFSTAYQGAETGICDYCTFDREAAKQALDAAGGFEGPVTITFPAGAGYDPTFEAIGNQIRQNLGIDVEYKTLPWAQFLEGLDAQKFDGLIRGHWGSLYPSMQEPLTALFLPGGVAQRAVGYENPRVTDLVEEANAETDEAAATAKYREAEDIVIADAAVGPLFYAAYVYVHSENVSNVVIDINQIELSDVVVEDA